MLEGCPENMYQLRREYEVMMHRIKPIVLAKCDHQCVKCHSKENLQVDHIIALSFGGNNDMGNFQILCKRCNVSKGGRRMPKNHNLKSRMIYLPLPDGLSLKVMELAKQEQRSYNWVVLEIVNEYFNKKNA